MMADQAERLRGEIIGFVDGFELPHIVRAWAFERLGDHLAPIDHVSVYLAGVLIGRAAPSFARHDVTSGSDVMVGFIVNCDGEFGAEDVMSGELLVRAQSGDGREQVLSIWDKAKAAVLRTEVTASLENADMDLVLSAIETFSRSSRIDVAARDLLERSRHILVRSPNEPPSNIVTKEISSMSFAIGTASADGSAVLGRDGFLFLTEGTNAVLSRYLTTLPQQKTLVTDWIALLERRLAVAEGVGSRFIQLIVPEKLSVLPHLFPSAIPVPTKLLSEIEHVCLADPRLSRPYVSALDSFRASPELCFQKTDSHPSPFGSFCIIQRVLEELGLPLMPQVTFELEIRGAGDLGKRFFGSQVFEHLPEPVPDSAACLATKPERLYFNKPGEGNSDAHVIWKNPEAPYDRKVVVFGNSCFAYGHAPSGLSWWFGRLFKEYHFFWKPEMDVDYVVKVAPDIVVCQTVERFLFTGAPKT